MKKKNKMAVLPPEIITGILSRLPVKSLLRFRCVSKPWCAEIDSPYFINLHLNRSTATKSNLSLFTTRQYQPDWRDGQHILFSVNFDSEVTEIKIPFINCEDRIRLWGSCNGLLLLQAISCKNSLFLFNPSTRKHLVLPDLPTRIKIRRNRWLATDEHYFFVYDDMNDDYKVFSILLQPSSYRQNRWLATEARVYSVKSNSWLTIKNFEDGVKISRKCGGFAYVNGALHSINETRDQGDPMNSTNIVAREIIAFDIVSGDRHVMPLPGSMGKYYSHYMSDKLVGGCLCVLNECIGFDYTKFNHTGSVDIWVMKEYGVRESWSMLLSVVIPKFYCFRRNLIYYSKSHNEVLLHLLDAHGVQVVWRNLETGTTMNFLPKGFPNAPGEPYICVESLVSVHIL